MRAVAAKALRSGGERVMLIPYHSDSLSDCQAFRFGHKRRPPIQPLLMETRAERRKRKLIALRDQFTARGGHVHIADEAGVSAEALDQVIKGVLLPAKKDGTRTPRSLGDTAARAIEQAFNLGRGWFDADEGDRQRAKRREISETDWATLADFKLLPDEEQDVYRKQFRSRAEKVKELARRYMREEGMLTEPGNLPTTPKGES